MDDLIERLRKQLAEWPFDYDPAITNRIVERAAAALRERLGKGMEQKA